MTERLELYRCETCGNIVQVLVSGEGDLICCGKAMNKLAPHNNDDNANEKHVPVFIKSNSGEEIVQVGSIPHPMTEEHYIQFIEVISDNMKSLCIKFLTPNDEPVKNLHCLKDAKSSLEYCNIHGLWTGHRNNNERRTND